MKQLGLPIADDPLAQALAEGKVAVDKAKRAKRGRITTEYRRLVHRMAARLEAELNPGKIRVRSYRRRKTADADDLLGLDA